MLVIRCTRDLLDDLDRPMAVGVSSNTALGDWFARPVVVGRVSWVVLMSARSRLPLVMPGDVRVLLRDFPDALGRLLLGLDVDPDAAALEVETSREVAIAATNDASVLASLNDFVSRLKRYLPDESLSDPTAISLWLGSVPLKALGFESPVSATRKLLS